MTFKDLADNCQNKFKTKIMIAKVGHQYHELSDTYNNESNVEFLDFFLDYPGNEVPTNSVLREFMGGSCFNVG